MIPACCIARQFFIESTVWTSMCNAMKCPGQGKTSFLLQKNMTGFFSVQEISSTSFVLSRRPWQNLWPGYRLGWHWGPGQEQCAASEMEGRQFEMLHKRWEPLLPLLLLLAIVSSLPASLSCPPLCLLNPSQVHLWPLSQSFMSAGEICALARQCSINSGLVTFPRTPGSFKLKRV